MRAELQQELLRLQRELKKSILFVSHDLNEAKILGNKIVILEAGKIVAPKLAVPDNKLQDA